jgi:hypothetical protein
MNYRRILFQVLSEKSMAKRFKGEGLRDLGDHALYIC